MARQKVKLAFIVNAAARRATYKKRSKSVLKKVNELSTLCGIDAFAIVYGPYGPEPEIWPSPPSEVQRVITKFRAKPEFEQSKKKLSQEDYLRQRIVKGEDQLRKLIAENRQNQMKMFMCQYFNGQIALENILMNNRNDFYWLVEQNLKDIDRILEAGSADNGQAQIITAPTPSQLQVQMTPPPPPPAPAAAAAAAASDEMATMMSHGHVGMAVNNDDIGSFMDLLNGNEDELASPFGQPHNANF